MNHRWAPVATAFGEVYQYTLEGEGYSAMALKTLHDWDVKYQLRAVPGVADVNTWGGLSQQFEVIVDPYRLQSHHLTLRDVFERIRDNNANFGGGFVEHGSEQYTVRGLGRVADTHEIESIVLDSHQGIAVTVRDVAEVRVGSMPRQGAVTRDGDGERVSGMVIMLKGQNSKTVIERVKRTLENMRASLPEGVRIDPFYDQSEVIDGTIQTVRDNLLKGGALVAVVLFLFLRQAPAALIVVAVIPLSMLVAFVGMQFFGITANLMSLGAVDFGMVVDGSVIMVENCIRRLRQRGVNPAATTRSHLEEIRAAAQEVGRPILMGVAIIIAVYIPILTLEDLEGRMFRPMAVTVCSALLGSLAITLLVVPAASRILLSNVKETPEPFMDRIRGVYRRVMERLIRRPLLVVAPALMVVVAAISSLAFIGTEFMPRLDEGSILVQTLKLPSISLTESAHLGLDVERTLKRLPEVTSVVTKIGRPDLATEAMGIYESDVYVGLKPREEWTTASTKEGLIQAMSEELSEIPGVVYNFTQPMAMRLDETISGVKADVAVKIFGEDETLLDRTADDVLRVLAQVPGAADTQKQIFSGAAEWQVHINRTELARYGLNVSDVRDLVQSAIAGKAVTELVEGRRRFPITVRLPETYRASHERIGDLLLRAPDGEQVPLSPRG